MDYSKEFKRLHAFKTVYEFNNFSKAAHHLFITQAGISLQIQTLEKDLGVTLFDRDGRNRISPTPAGDILYKQVVEMLGFWSDTLHQINDATNHRQQCSIAVSHTFAQIYMDTLLIDLVNNHPNTDFTVRVENSEVVQTLLLQKDIDFGIVEKPFPHQEYYHIIEMMDDSLVLAGNPDSNYWLMREETSGVYHYNQIYKSEASHFPSRHITINNNTLILKLLDAGFGQTVLSKESLKGHVIPYTHLGPAYSRYFYAIANAVPSRIFNSIEPTLLKWLSQYA